MSVLLGALADDDKLKKLASNGLMGAVPMLLARNAQKDAAEEERQKVVAASGQGMKKGGAVRGWGKARGARAAKYY